VVYIDVNCNTFENRDKPLKNKARNNKYNLNNTVALIKIIKLVYMRVCVCVLRVRIEIFMYTTGK